LPYFNAISFQQVEEDSDIEDEEDGLSPTLRRMICAQTINALASSTGNAFLLLQYDILKVINNIIFDILSSPRDHTGHWRFRRSHQLGPQ
jgi:hypothetical protein